MRRGRCPPTEYRPPEVPTDVFATSAGPEDCVSSIRDLTVPAFLMPERKLLFPVHWIGPPSGEKTAEFRLQPSATAVSQSGNAVDSLRESANVPDVSREGLFDVRRDRPHPDALLHSSQDSQGCPFRITSYDLEIDGSDFSPEYGVQLHDPRLLEYVGAPES